MQEVITWIQGHLFFEILLYAVILDTVLGVLRAVKEHKFNSSAGIDGAIRKIAMIFSVMFLILVDSLIDMNFLFMIPEEYMKYLGLSKLGICELFCMLFIMYEAVSILKNMTLCGLPVPAKIKYFIQKFLDNMTEELPEEIIKELHEKEVDAGTYNQIHEDNADNAEDE